jgi:hypothetical protein
MTDRQLLTALYRTLPPTARPLWFEAARRLVLRGNLLAVIFKLVCQ